MTVVELKNQLKAIIDVEQQIKEQDEIIKNASNKMSSLGIPNKNLYPPQKIKLKYKPERGMVFRAVIGILISISSIPILYMLSAFFFDDMPGKWILIAIFVIAIEAFPWIQSYRSFRSKQKKLDEEYKDLLFKYNDICIQDKKRVDAELAQKASLEAEINNANWQKEQLKHVCEQLYEFSGIRREYWKFDAVNHFYEYLDKERTYGLTYNLETGDRGAYDIYDNELLLRKTLMSINELLIGQDEIVNSVDTAEQKLSEMSTNLVTYFSHSLQYQQEALDSTLRTEAYAAKTAADTGKIRRNTKKTRQNIADMNRRDRHRFFWNNT